MGYAVAERAVLRGADVVLICGPTHLGPPAGARVVSVRTTSEMRDAVVAELDGADLVVMAAAPADYRPAEVASQKIKKTSDLLTLELVRTEDILSEVRSKKEEKTGVVGFALETENVLENARKKLAEKGLDLIVANDLNEEGAGFAVETNVATLVGRSGAEESPGLLSKIELADLVLSAAVRELGWGSDDGAKDD
jgi:phosphopantothenoylcysteine decarboxylase/phosphopantothenate--cysteine ligase